MKAVRLVTFKAIRKDGVVKIVRIDSNDILNVAAGLKRAGYKIVRNSFSVSDTIVMGNTNIIKKCA